MSMEKIAAAANEKPVHDKIRDILIEGTFSVSEAIGLLEAIKFDLLIELSRSDSNDN